MEIKGRPIGPGHPVYLVAEMSGNHQKDLGKALVLMETAKEAGADAVKVQTYTADTLTLDSEQPWFRVGGGTLWDGQKLYELYEEAMTPWEWYPLLKGKAEQLGMDLFSTAFDPAAVDFLEGQGVPCHKVASFELVDLPLIEKMAATGKPLIMSTGMATQEEIGEALQAARQAGAKDIALLFCNSSYPAPLGEMDLKTIPHMAQQFGLPVGLSDHTLGGSVPVAAVALGACIIEKHFTLSRTDPGPDSAFSLEPHEFMAMARALREVETALGEVRYGPTPHQQKSLAFRRSLFVVQDVEAGQVFTKDNLRSIRPSDGLAPKYLKEVLGRRARRDVARGTPLSWDLVEGGGEEQA